ncbi:AsmA family protein [Rosistilla carotiformis]|uniref:AsmA family protein n=1 Tax=Rosistilla carotiformis TaxID=2528017 RepID=A0A518JVC9_9BACT|nr:TIGR03545 family protein [Rosistilla carotiformis]QDV69501.1 AsmA family protein [Rosistilla carotiformis]
MIRWRFLLTRVLIIVLVIALMRLALGPAVRYTAVQALQKLTGGRVDIAQTHIDLWPPRIYFEQVHIADPSKEKEDAVQAELIEVRLQPSALVRRQWVVEKARITGLKINEARTTDGRLAATEPAASSGPSFSGKLAGILEAYAKDSASAFARDLETVKTSEEIRVRWKNEYESLTARAKQLEGAIREVRDGIQGIDNPLRDLPQLQRALQQAEAIRQDLLVVRKAIDDLPLAVQADLERMEQARRADVDRVAQYIPLADGQAADFSPEMFRQVVTTQLDRVRGFLDGSRSVADWTVVSPELERTRGKDINFMLGKLPPNWLVQVAEVSGQIQVDGVKYDLQGVMENVTTQPMLANGPLVGRLKLDGPQIVRVDFQRHTEDQRSWDDVTLHWPQLPINTLAVGESKQTSIRLEPGGVELWVQMTVEGEQVDGKLISQMRNTHVSAEIPSNKYNAALVSSLTDSLQNVREVNVEARFGGRWDTMKINVASNLSGLFSSAVKNGVTAQTAATKQQLMGLADNAYRDQVGQLQVWLTQQQTQVRKTLTDVDGSVEEISQKLVKQLGAPDLYLGRLQRGLEVPMPKF